MWRRIRRVVNYLDVAVFVALILYLVLQAWYEGPTLIVTQLAFFPNDLKNLPNDYEIKIYVRVANYGNHAATVTHLDLNWSYGDLPLKPKYYDINTLDHAVIMPGSYYEIERSFRGGPTPTKFSEISAGNTSFNEYGYIEYNTSIPFIKRYSGFCFRYVPTQSRSSALQSPQFVECASRFYQFLDIKLIGGIISN